jgi:hypothetical protein
LESAGTGLLHVDSTLFGSTNGVANNSRIVNISGMFLNNSSLSGNIPLFDEGIYTDGGDFHHCKVGIYAGQL